MATSIVKRAWQFFVPGGLVLLLAIGFLRPQGLPAWVQGPVSALPLVVLGFGIVFGWYLSSSRLILSLLVLVCLDRGIVSFASATADPDARGSILFAIATFLAPVSLLTLSLVKEGGVSSWRSVVSLLLIVSQPFLALWLCLPEQAHLADPFRLALVPLRTFEWTPLPQPALLAFGSALVLLTAKSLLYQDPLDSGAVWGLLTTFLAVHGIRYGWNPTNFLSAAGLILFLALVQASHQRTYRDELTGALGRLAFDEIASRLGERYVVAIVGVDQLKQYQNQYGRPVAEQVLRLVVPKIMAAAGTGKVYRLAGDELTLLFTARTATDTLATFEKIRKTVEQISLRLRNQTRVWEGSRAPGSRIKDLDLPLSASIGVAEATPPGPLLTVVTKTAYRALYEAKGEGGNIVRRATMQAAPVKSASQPTGRIVAYSAFDR